METDEIIKSFTSLRNQWGEKPKSFKKAQLPEHRSIQGHWTPETYSKVKINEANHAEKKQ